MHTKPLEPNEPVVLALVDAVIAWQGALEQTLSTSGLNYGKWVLLRAIWQNVFVRNEPLAGVMLIDAACAERMLGGLHNAGWVEYSATGAPRISAAAEGRVERVWGAVKALHSVSVAPFNSHERVALGTLLQRMKLTLSDHSARRSRGAASEPVMVPPAAGHVATSNAGTMQSLPA